LSDYAFPADLADRVAERWHTMAARHEGQIPALPRTADLRHVLATAFFASFEREEGRNLRFVLCCSPDLEVTRDGLGEVVPLMPLETPRPVSVATLRSLAPAVNSNNAAILIRCPIDGEEHRSEVAGVLHVGANLARARNGRSFYYRPAPHALIVDVRDAGELHIYQGGMKLAAMKAGRLHDQIAYSALEFLPISDILARGEHALRPRIATPGHEPAHETSDFQWTALLNTILCIVNGVKEHEHGGTVLLVSPDSAPTLPIHTKFDIHERVHLLANRFVQFLNARHQLADARWRRNAAAHIEAHATALSMLENATFDAEEQLADAADLVARLTAVDGALVLTSDLRVLGFGAEIVLDTTVPISAYEVVGNPDLTDSLPEVDSQSFGMRHRSALRCVSVSTGVAAFVVSQDNSVSFIWKKGRKVLLKKNVNTSNPNMVGA
jgi:sensor domain DACNV-containing protein